MNETAHPDPAAAAAARARASGASTKPIAPLSRDDRWNLLMIQAQGGDDRSYRILISELYPWLRGYFRRRYHPAMSEDAVQDVLSALHQKRSTFEAGRPFRPWLAAIARYKGIDHLRAYHRTSLDALSEFVVVDCHEKSVTSAIVVKALLSRLKPAQADAIRLAKLQGYSVKETSAATGQSESLVKVNIHRGMGKFATMLMVADGDRPGFRARPGCADSTDVTAVSVRRHQERAAEGPGHRGLAGEASAFGSLA